MTGQAALREADLTVLGGAVTVVLPVPDGWDVRDRDLAPQDGQHDPHLCRRR